MIEKILQNSKLIITVIAILAVVIVYILARLFSVASRRKHSIFSKRKNQYKDSTRKKKNFDGTVYHRFKRKNKRR